MGRVLISLDIILLAWMVVAVTGKVMRNNLVFVILFVALMSMGICVYSEILDHEFVELDLKNSYLYPIVNTLSIFFPSRGDYVLSWNDAYSWYYLLHFLGYFLAAWILFLYLMFNNINLRLKECFKSFF